MLWLCSSRALLLTMSGREISSESHRSLYTLSSAFKTDLDGPAHTLYQPRCCLAIGICIVLCATPSLKSGGRWQVKRAVEMSRNNRRAESRQKPWDNETDGNRAHLSFGDCDMPSTSRTADALLSFRTDMATAAGKAKVMVAEVVSFYSTWSNTASSIRLRPRVPRP